MWFEAPPGVRAKFWVKDWVRGIGWESGRLVVVTGEDMPRHKQ